MSKLRIVIIVQARMGSTRLPEKIMKKVLERPLLSYLIERLRRVKLADEIVIATTRQFKDNVIVDFCRDEKVKVFQGSEDNVLDRYYQAATAFQADIVVRITSDCPLIDPKIIDHVIDTYLKNYPVVDYISNSLTRSFPRGMDVEVFSYKNLEKANVEARDLEEREHVTPFFYRHPQRFKLLNIQNQTDESHHRWTVDTLEDFELISKILANLYPKIPDFTMEDILKLLQKHPEWSLINAHIRQKELKNVQSSQN